MPSAFCVCKWGSAQALGLAQFAVLGLELPDLGRQRTDVTLQLADAALEIVNLGQCVFVYSLFGLVERQREMQFADLFLDRRLFGLFLFGFPANGQTYFIVSRRFRGLA
jgi:hypothetical protein